MHQWTAETNFRELLFIGDGCLMLLYHQFSALMNEFANSVFVIIFLDITRNCFFMHPLVQKHARVVQCCGLKF